MESLVLISTGRVSSLLYYTLALSGLLEPIKTIQTTKDIIKAFQNTGKKLTLK
jgi:hypothetical protein